MVVCYIQGCNTEAYVPLMIYYFSSKYSKKPFAKAIIRACWNHARRLGDEDAVSKIQVLA
ncbi:MAG: conserved hypothetical protein [Marine Group I thaumarchaeote]|nr:MAG: conserved hypothetical protein [Marine Group I thaumarchaeote]